jgi:hypothetical protein
VAVLCCAVAVLFCAVLWLFYAVQWLFWAVLCCDCAVLCCGCSVAVHIDLPSLTLNSPEICTNHATWSAVDTATSGRRNPFRFQFICQAKTNLATFEVPTAVLLMSQVFWDVTLPALLGPENEGVLNLRNFEHYCPSDTASPRRELGCSM